MERKFLIRIDGMMCQKNCASTVENALRNIAGVKSATVIFSIKLATVIATCPLNELISTVEDIGFEAKSLTDTKPDHTFVVNGMMCQKNCASTVENAILGLNGVIFASVDFSSKTAKVWGGVSPGSILEVIESVGFEGSSSELDSFKTSDDTPDFVIKVNKNYISAADAQTITKLLSNADGVLSIDVRCDQGLVKIWGFADADKIIDILENNNFPCKSFASESSALKTEIDNKHVSGNTSISAGVHRSGSLMVADIQFTRKADVPHPEAVEVLLKRNPSVVSVRHAALTEKLFVVFDPSTGLTGGDIAGLLSSAYEATVRDTYLTSSDKNKVHRKEYKFDITGMSCANCAIKVEKTLASLPGVVQADVSCMTNVGLVIVDDFASDAVGPRTIVEAVEALGYFCQYISPENRGQVGGSQSDDLTSWRRLLVVCGIFGLPVLFFHMAMITSSSVMELSMMPVPSLCRGGITTGQLIMALLNTPLQVVVGYRFYRGAFMGAMHGSFGMDCLVVTGTTITYVYSVTQLAFACRSGVPSMHVFLETSGMLLMFVTLGKFLESYARKSTASAMSSLLALQPHNANLVKGMQTSHEKAEVVDVDLVQRGDIVKVLPGERLPTDGVVVAGTSFVDESLITGESVPVSRKAGDAVYGSTINQKGVLYLRVTSLGSESALAQIVELVGKAQMSKAPIQAYADYVAGVFTPCVLLLATVTFVVWFYASSHSYVPQSWFLEAGYGSDPLLFSLLFGISVVVISCPCALGLATPTAIMVGTSVGAQNGILIKGGLPFEVANRVTTIIFDKTGTLTHGKPTVTDEIMVADPTALKRLNMGDLSEKDIKSNILKIAAIAESGSEHPLASAILSAARERHIEFSDADCKHFTHCVGGVTCIVSNSLVCIGNRGHMESNKIIVGPAIDGAMWDLEVQGKTALCLSIDDFVVCIFGIADAVKAEAVTTIIGLKSMGIDLWMISGDNRTTCEAVADELGISNDRVIAGVLPLDKVSKVEELQRAGGVVAMIGDGINDAPALARSDLGIAIGAGTHVAIEAADMVLIRNNLHDVILAFDLARTVFKRIRINLVWAMVYNVLTIPVAAGIWFPWTHAILPPQYAGMCMAMSSISVVASSMTLKLYKRPQLIVNKAVMGKNVNDSIISRAKKRMKSLKNSITKRIGHIKGSSKEYSMLPNSDDDFGLELGLGGLNGLPDGDHDFDDEDTMFNRML